MGRRQVYATVHDTNISTLRARRCLSVIFKYLTPEISSILHVLLDISSIMYLG